MKVERVSRLIKIIRMLESGRAFEPDRLAKSLRISRRTLFRDLKLLDEAGVGYAFNRRRKGYSPKHEGVLPPVHLTPSEALSLLMLVRLGLKQPFLPDRHHAASAAMKIESLLPRNLQDYCGPLLEHVDALADSHSDTTSDAGRLIFFQRAMASELKVDVTYQSLSPREVVQTMLGVYRVVHIHRGWYVLGHSEKHEAVRTFKLQRFLSMKPTQTPYRIDPAFSLDRYFGQAWCMIPEGQIHHVRIVFSPMVASNVAEILWHPTQRLTHCEDGSLLFEVDVDGLKEISWWIMGYGDQARVIEPDALRDMVARRLQNGALTYAEAVVETSAEAPAATLGDEPVGDRRTRSRRGAGAAAEDAGRTTPSG